MMMAEHSKEPWRIGSKFEDGLILDASSNLVSADCDPEDARRIVACVNACAGKDEEVLEFEGVMLCSEHAAEMALLKDQRDQLLAALREYSKANNPSGVCCVTTAYADAAIAAVEQPKEGGYK